MGFFDLLLGNKNQIPTVTSILPDAAKQEILAGRLPVLRTDKLFLKKGEKIHYIDKAVNIEKKMVKQYRHYGYSMPGLFKGTRWSSGRGKTIENTELVQHRGILYITNQRVVFQAKEWGFDKTYRYLSAITPYSDASVLAAVVTKPSSNTSAPLHTLASSVAADPFAPANNAPPLVLDMSNIPNPDDFDEGAVW